MGKPDPVVPENMAIGHFADARESIYRSAVE